MKYNEGGPGACWGDVSTEGKQLFVCLSLTLGLPFISLQGCRAVFTPGQLFSAFPSALSLPLLFMPSLKALLDDHQGLPLKLSSPIFVYLVVIIQTLPQVQGIHSRVNLWKGLGQVVFDIGILQVCANGMLVSCWGGRETFHNHDQSLPFLWLDKVRGAYCCLQGNAAYTVHECTRNQQQKEVTSEGLEDTSNVFCL